MTVLEMCAVAVAISSGIVAATAVAGLVSLWRLRRRVEAMSAQTYNILGRLNAVAGDLESIVRRARRLERRVHHGVDLLLDGIEPLLLVVSTAIAAARTGLTSWMNSRPDGARGEDGNRTETVPQKGDAHEQDTKR